MTVSNTNNKVSMIGNGTTTTLSITYKYLDKTDVKVYKNVSGVQTLMILGTDYTIQDIVNTQGNITGGTITFTVAPESGLKIIAIREVPLTQEIDYQENEIFPAETQERGLDKLTMQVQQLKEQADRAVTLGLFSDVTPAVLIEEVERVWSSIDNVDTCANNITEIQNASTNANTATLQAQLAVNASSAAAISATLASQWATQLTTPVEGGEYSAKQYAQNAGMSAQNAGTSEVNSSGSATAASNSATLAQDWAVKMDGQVASTDYSSKYYASQSAVSAQDAQDALDNVVGLIATPIGTIFMSIYVDESLDIARRLNGQLISSTKFTGFRTWLNDVRTAFPSLFTTEVNWQSEKSLSKLGQCGKFVIDDTAGTIRLPCVVNAQSLTDLQYLGTIKSESLPNLSGYFHINGNASAPQADKANGCFYFQGQASSSNNYTDAANASSAYEAQLTTLDASRSSSTYQDGAPVQQEAIQYPYYIQVATGIEETLPAIREYEINTPFFFGKSMYSDVDPYNASWLVSNGQYNAKTVYPDYYDWLLAHVGETITTNGGNVVLSTDAITDYDWVVNTGDETFRLPLLDGSEDLPSDRYEDLTLASTPQSFTAPANGIYTIVGVGVGWVDIANETSGAFGSCSQPRTTDGFGRYTLKAKRGDKINIYCGAIPSSYVCRFIYAKGNGFLYYYVGDTVQDASLINAGAVLGQLATKTSFVEAAAASMPSNRYIDLTLGASGSTYTAPANGYLFFRKQATTANQYIYLSYDGGGDAVQIYSGGTGSDLGAFVPLRKGQPVIVAYDAAGALRAFRFYYAEGDQ